MPKAKKSKKIVALTWGQLKERTMNAHPDSKLIVVVKDWLFGGDVSFHVKEVKIIMRDSGQPDFLEMHI